MKWQVPKKRVKQADLTGMSEEKLKFLIKSVYDLLPTPANKTKLFVTEERCLLCVEYGKLNHILAGFKVALSQGRYKWRHDKVLTELAAAVQRKLAENKEKVGEEKRKSCSLKLVRK